MEVAVVDTDIFDLDVAELLTDGNGKALLVGV
jgi:hypothetical protein